MKEFIDKLISRLEEKEVQAYAKTDGGVTYTAYRNAISIVIQLAEEYNNEPVKGDLISRSALLKQFAEATPYGCGTVGIKFVDELIKNQPTVCNDDWIPCSERLPLTTGYFLVTIQGFSRPMYAWWLSTERKWQYLNSTKVIEDVIAWCKLPASYQPKGE